MKVTENDIKRILTKEVMEKLIDLAQFRVKIYGEDYGVVLRDLAVEWVAHEIKTNNTMTKTDL